jgi:hypothetical protein
MPHLTTRTDPDIKAAFSNRAKARGMTESELLRALVVAEIGNDLADEKPAESNQEKTETERITVRMPGFMLQAAKDKGKGKGMATSRWIAALVQSNIAKNPVMTDQELITLKATIRELIAIGRNINQMARALNESKNNTDKVKLTTLALLGESMKRNISAVRELVRASQQVWEAE